MTKVDMFFNLIAGGIIVLLLMSSGSVFSQQSISMADAESRREVSMANAQGKISDGVYRYYAKGDNEPYTGVLFAKYPNGNFSSWQEYVDGLGQGQWINYYENGNYREKGFYNKNLVEGPISKYYENGVLKAVFTRIGELRLVSGSIMMKKVICCLLRIMAKKEA